MKRKIFLIIFILLGAVRLWAQSNSWQLEQSHFDVSPDGGLFSTLVSRTESFEGGGGDMIYLGDLQLTSNYIADAGGQIDSIYFKSSRLYVVFKSNHTSRDINNIAITIFFKDAIEGGNTTYTTEFTYTQSGHHSLFGGEIESSDRIYELGEQPSAIVSVAPAAAGEGVYAYSWEHWTAESHAWQTVPGATSLSLQSPTPLVSATEHYRRKVTSGSRKAYSNVVSIKTHLDGGAISLTQRDGKLVLESVRCPRLYSTTIRWQSSTDMTHWNYIDKDPVDHELQPIFDTSATYGLGNFDLIIGEQSYTVDIPQRTTYYRREITDYGGQKAYSNIVYWREVDFSYIDRVAALDAAAANTVVDRVYYDGLGREMQSVAVAAAPSGADIVTQSVYDAAGRPDRGYLPFAVADNGGAYVPQPLARQAEFYRTRFDLSLLNTITPYTRTVYDGTPFDRPAETHRPDMKDAIGDRCTSVDYSLNADSEVLDLRVADADGSLRVVGWQPAGMLFSTAVTDEDGHTAVTFADSYGRTILSRTLLSVSDCADTYYVYDDLGHLRWVVSPEGSARLSTGTVWFLDSDDADRYCYRYTYDGRGLKIETRLPGRDVIFTVYDLRDRIAATQDGNMRENGEWLFTDYDALDRPVRQFLAAYFSPVGALRSQFSAALRPAILSDTTGTDLVVTHYGSYTNQSGLEFEPDSLADASQVDTLHLKGFKTEETLAATDGSGNSVRVYYYDFRGRVVQSVERNTAGGILRTSYRYDYRGNNLASQQHYRQLDSLQNVLCDDTYLQTFEYDDRGRLLSDTAEFVTDGDTSQPAEVHYTYDDLGMLASKANGSGPDACVEKLKYNIQGWLTNKDVENPADNITDLSDLQPEPAGPIDIGFIQINTPIFSMKLHYYDPVQSATAPSYTGNISEWDWRFDSDRNTYAFTYDNLSRLTGTEQYVNGVSVNNNIEKGLKYDRNSNITALQRYADGRMCDDFDVAYNGNRINTIEAKATDTTSTYECGYDNNGNMTANKIQNFEISYNILNLPQKITTETGKLLARYTYLADATKFAVEDSVNDGYMYVGSLVYRKRNGEQSLESAAFGGGRFRVSQGADGVTYIPNYYITDHLGSTRAIVENGQAIAEYNYYPYGLEWSTANMLHSDDNRYKFSGKESQSDFGANLYDFHARTYTPLTTMFIQQDPKSQDYYSISPYAYCAGNPIKNIDYTGKSYGDYFDSEGNFLFTDNIDDGKIYEIVPAPAVSIDIAGSGEDLILYVGNIENISLCFTGQANENNSAQADGVVYIIYTGSNGKKYGRMSIGAIGGPYGNGAPENGLYTIDTPRLRSEKGYTLNGIGFSFNLNPTFVTNRTYLRVHPDGNMLGTLGCVGLNGTFEELKLFYNIVSGEINNRGSLNMVINIFGNPNNNGRIKQIPNINE